MRVERAAEALAHAHAVAHAGDERVVHLASGLVGHAERAVVEAGGDVLRRRAEARDLVVVNRRRAVHRDVRDDAASHEVDEHGREAGLHDVAAEHDDDAALRVAPRRRWRRRRRGSRARRGRRGARARKARSERSSPGGCANRAALTLFGRTRDGNGAHGRRGPPRARGSGSADATARRSSASGRGGTI